MSWDDAPGPSAGIDPGASRWIFMGMVGLMLAGAIAYYALRPRPAPPPPDIVGDPLLVEGRDLYLARCVSCHGTSGKGDGPIAKGLPGPPPGDLTDGAWKHGDRPEQVLAVISRGVPETGMSGWAGTFRPAEIRAVAAFTYYLAGRPVPDQMRSD